MEKNLRKCTVCKKSVPDLPEHMKIHKTFSCNECNKPFYRKCALTYHLKTHTDEKHEKCVICNIFFKTRFDFKEHRKIHLAGENSKILKCDVCEAKFSQITSLITHKRIHTGEKPYKCNVCEKSFRDYGNFSRHKYVHSGERPYKCEKCEKTFCLANNLKRHAKTHAEKAYKCDNCDKSFRKSEQLTKHKLKNHAGEKRFKCDLCDIGFDRSGDFLNHKMIHTGQNPYKCEYCNRTFYHSRALNNHKKIHTGEKTEKYYRCKVCHAKFITLERYEFHLTMHNTPKPSLKCEICNIEFLHHSDLENHKITHNLGECSKLFKCNSCEASFSRRHDLTVHLATHTTEKSYTCKASNLTGVLNTLARHEKILLITEQKFIFDLKCNFCNKLFSSRDLTSHVESHKNKEPDLFEFISTGVDPLIAEKNHPIVPIQSEVVSKALKQLAELDKHKKVGFKCDYCEMLFVSENYLNEHLKTHKLSEPQSETIEEIISIEDVEVKTEKNDYSTEPTSKSPEKHLSRDPSALQISNALEQLDKLDVNTEELLKNKAENAELKTCKKCGKTFGSSKILFQHYATHLDEKERKRLGNLGYRCNYCKILFTRKDYLIGHLKIHKHDKSELEIIGSVKEKSEKIEKFNNESKKSKEREINLALKQLAELDSEVKFKNGKPKKRYQCDVCEKTYFFANPFKKHKESHLKEKGSTKSIKSQFEFVSIEDKQIKTEKSDDLGECSFSIDLNTPSTSKTYLIGEDLDVEVENIKEESENVTSNEDNSEKLFDDSDYKW